MKPGRLLAALGGVLLLAGAAWSIGFATFMAVARQNAPLPARADGIVVLTGGAGRVEAALRLLADGRAPALLISGVAPRTDFAAIAHGQGIEAEALASRVTLGHAAQTTRGNAREAAAWARAMDAHSLVLVTAGYHMPRALLELRRALEGVRLYPVPVQSPALRGVESLRVLRLFAGEFDKLLAAYVGVRRVGGGA